MVTVLNDNKKKEHEASGPNQNFKINIKLFFFFCQWIIVEKIKQGNNDRPFPTPGIEPGRGGESAES